MIDPFQLRYVIGRIEQVMIRPSHAIGRSAASEQAALVRSREWARRTREQQIAKGLCRRGKCLELPLPDRHYCLYHVEMNIKYCKERRYRQLRKNVTRR